MTEKHIENFDTEVTEDFFGKKARARRKVRRSAKKERRVAKKASRQTKRAAKRELRKNTKGLFGKLKVRAGLGKESKSIRKTHKATKRNIRTSFKDAKRSIRSTGSYQKNSIRKIVSPARIVPPRVTNTALGKRVQMNRNVPSKLVKVATRGFQPNHRVITKHTAKPISTQPSYAPTETEQAEQAEQVAKIAAEAQENTQNAQEGKEGQDSTAKKPFNWKLYGGIGGGVVVLIIIIVLIMMFSKKK